VSINTILNCEEATEVKLASRIRLQRGPLPVVSKLQGCRIRRSVLVRGAGPEPTCRIQVQMSAAGAKPLALFEQQIRHLQPRHTQ
jgi:hypothetical protein